MKTDLLDRYNLSQLRPKSKCKRKQNRKRRISDKEATKFNNVVNLFVFHNPYFVVRPTPTIKSSYF